MNWFARLVLAFASLKDSYNNRKTIKKGNPHGQPELYRIDSAIVWSLRDGLSTDVTGWFVRVWSGLHYGRFSIDELQSVLRKITSKNHSQFVLEINYSMGPNKEYKVIYDDTLIYPPYNNDDERVPRFRFFQRDVSSASLVHGIELDEYVDEDEEVSEQEECCNEIRLVTEDILKLCGPATHFYSDTEIKLTKDLIRDWIKAKTGVFDCMLQITWTDGEYEIF